MKKNIRDAALEAGGNLILLQKEGLAERFSPHGYLFNLCQEGRLLILAPWPDNSSGKSSRQECLQMNEMTNEISRYGLLTKIKRK